MLKTALLTLLSLLISATTFAQKNNTAQHDSTAYWMRTSSRLAYSEEDAQFLRLIIKADSGMFVVQDFYKDGTLRLLAKSLQREMYFERYAQGSWLEYYPTGSKKYAKTYLKGQLVGGDTSFYANGNVVNIISHSAAGYFLQTCKDATGKVIADNGNGNWISLEGDDNEVVFSGPVVNGRENGLWTEKRPNDTTAYTVEFKNGAVVAGTDNRLVKHVLTAVETQPSFGKSENDFNIFLAKTVRYPKDALENNITGVVIVTFVVEKDGSLSDLKIYKSPHESLSQEALRVVKLSPKWHPAMQDGKPVRVNFSVPVAFALAKDE